MKHPKLLYGFITVIGIVLLSILFTIMADDALYDYIWGLLSSIQHLMTFFGMFCLLGGTFFLTTGIVGIGRHYLRNSPNQFTRLDLDSFTILAVVSILSVVFGLFLYFWMGALTAGV